MKTVLLEIINGPQANQKICIRLGVAIKLGSGRLADLSVNSDPTLAPVHASIGHRRAGCFIECIEPDGQVLINGKSMQRSRLHHGDIIIAGNTQFKVSVISEDAAEPSAVEPAKPTPEVITEKPANAQVVPKPMANSPQAEITNHATVEMIS